MFNACQFSWKFDIITHNIWEWNIFISMQIYSNHPRIKLNWMKMILYDVHVVLVVLADATILLLQIRLTAIHPFYFNFSGVEFLFQYFLCIEQKVISMHSSHNLQRVNVNASAKFLCIQNQKQINSASENKIKNTSQSFILLMFQCMIDTSPRQIQLGR